MALSGKGTSEMYIWGYPATERTQIDTEVRLGRDWSLVVDGAFTENGGQERQSDGPHIGLIPLKNERKVLLKMCQVSFSHSMTIVCQLRNSIHLSNMLNLQSLVPLRPAAGTQPQHDGH